jgi:hypothetical protein
MRRIHDATAVFMPPKDERWFTGRTMQPGWIVRHQDAAPYNAVMNGDRLVGFFDWDTASPSPPDDDLAFSALLWVPLTARMPASSQARTMSGTGPAAFICCLTPTATTPLAR